MFVEPIEKPMPRCEDVGNIVVEVLIKNDEILFDVSEPAAVDEELGS